MYCIKVWEEQRTGEPADIPTILREKAEMKKLYMTMGIDPDEPDVQDEFLLDCQISVR
jgi:hypothetical protein